jgi:hypothetical protein
MSMLQWLQNTWIHIEMGSKHFNVNFSPDLPRKPYGGPKAFRLLLNNDKAPNGFKVQSLGIKLRRRFRLLQELSSDFLQSI